MLNIHDKFAHQGLAALAAFAILGLSAFTLEQGHQGALPRGTIELGELVPVDTMALASVELPSVVVTATRLGPEERLADARPTELPAVVVTARRDLYGLALG